MVSGDDSAGSVISEINSAILNVKEGDKLAESGKRKLAADRYLEAITQLKSVRRRNQAQVDEVVDELLRCANQRGRMLIDERPLSNARDIDEVFDETRINEGFDTIDWHTGVKNEEERIFRDVRKRIVTGNRLQNAGKYGEAIECYREAREITDQQLPSHTRRRLESEIDIYMRKARPKKRQAARRLKKLDVITRQLNQELLARHGFELPYRRAAADPQTVDDPVEVVYTPPLNPDIVNAAITYYRELGPFERQLTATATETDGPTPVTDRLGAIVESRHPDAPTSPEDSRDVVGAAVDILEAYESLVVEGDDDGIAELESQLDTVYSDMVACRCEDTEALAVYVDDIQAWASNRARRANAVTESIKELNTAIRQLNQELLARHGFELPYRCAAANTEMADEPDEVVYTPPFDPNLVDAITTYYRELGSFEHQLASAAAETGEPTVVMELLGAILEARHPDVPTNPEDNRELVGAAVDILEAYESLVVEGDDDGIAELESQLDTVYSDMVACRCEDTEALAVYVDDIQAWASNRARRANAVTESIKELNTAIRQLNQELLARHGFELPYRCAAANTEMADEPDEVVYTPPFDPNLVDAITTYYRELGSFEHQLASAAAETGEPTVVMELLGAILEARHPDVPTNPEDNRELVGAASNFLDAYESLVVKGDDDGVAELESQLDTVYSDVTAGEYEADSKALAARFNDIQSWIDERVHRIDLQSWRAEIREKWPATAGEHLRLEVAVVDQLTDSDSSEPSLSQFESGLKTAEQVLSLATAVETAQKEYQAAVLDGLPEAFGRYLGARDISATRINQLAATLEVVETACDAHRRYPSYPFGQVVAHICAELETGTFDDELDELVELIESATNVIEFLDRVDTEHPSIQPDVWRENIHTGLKSVSPELVRPVASLVDRMGENLWERRHLYLFSWEEFEQVVAAAFESKGYETRVTPSTLDEGVDIWAYHQGDRIAFQVKQFDTSNRVGRPTLQKLASTIAKGDADRAIVVTSSNFTQTAQKYVDEFGRKMRLVDGTELVQMLTESDYPPPLTE
ncbi:MULTISPECIES: restriction endonuclease [Haloferax]|uniref:Restriction endonuclease type IV Mrr domain-containing protein n=1 Tax=Haloferax marinum TaxID=2666143 RepID=A0A6A8G634_9EURY|nr:MULTISPECIES: restriction endonuclease [Haloferax]KAB1196583.1 restriction endonuclease [Haloferax sp. CBA1150]MRW95586.1 hypothetical protein [Haloferax marinum]